ncbi:hypothetical protein CR513_32972, partial [Mucuna pruriens]
MMKKGHKFFKAQNNLKILENLLMVHLFKRDMIKDNDLMDLKLKQMLKKKGKYKHFSIKKDKYNKYPKKENNEIICFKCKKARHIKDDYFKLKKK